MMKRAVLSLVLLGAFAASAMAQAAGAPATLVMRSGERIAADVIDIAAPGLLIRQNGQERNVPPSEVAQIDFAGDGRSSSGVGGNPQIQMGCDFRCPLDAESVHDVCHHLRARAPPPRRERGGTQCSVASRCGRRSR